MHAVSLFAALIDQNLSVSLINSNSGEREHHWLIAMRNLITGKGYFD